MDLRGLYQSRNKQNAWLYLYDYVFMYLFIFYWNDDRGGEKLKRGNHQ